MSFSLPFAFGEVFYGSTLSSHFLFEVFFFVMIGDCSYYYFAFGFRTFEIEMCSNQYNWLSLTTGVNSFPLS